jgi:4-amino-4-deoxy-L-arabinose transferase-like glycosyltransferase
MSNGAGKFMRVGDAGLTVLFTLGTALRFLNLGRQSVWSDEGGSWLVTQLNFADLFRSSWQDVHPPLYFFLLKLFLYFVPSTEYGLRLLSSLCSVATLATVILFVRQQWGCRAAWYAGLLVAISPLDIYYAQETRMYSLLAFLFVLSYVFLVKSLQSGKSSNLAVWAAANVGLAWTHAYGLIAVFLQVGFVIVYRAWCRLRGQALPLNGRQLSVALAGVIVGILPMLILFWSIKSEIPGSTQIPNLHNLRYLLAFWVSGPMDAFPAFLIPWRMRDLTLLAVLGCAIAGAVRCWHQSQNHKAVVILSFALILFPAAFVYGCSVLLNRPLWIERGFIGGAPVLFVLTGLGLSVARPWAMRGLITAVIAVSLIFGAIFYYTKWEKCQAAKAFRSLPPTDADKLILASPDCLSSEAHFYLRRQKQVWGIRPEPPGQLIRVLFSQGQMPQETVVEDNDPDLRSASDVYAYGDPHKLRAERPLWPKYFASKQIWIFEDSRWHRIDE